MKGVTRIAILFCLATIVKTDPVQDAYLANPYLWYMGLDGHFENAYMVDGLARAQWVGLEPWLQSIGLLQGDRGQRELQGYHNFTMARTFETRPWISLTNWEKTEMLYYRQTLLMWTSITSQHHSRMYNVTYNFAVNRCPTHLLDLQGLRMLDGCKCTIFSFLIGLFKFDWEVIFCEVK